MMKSSSTGRNGTIALRTGGKPPFLLFKNQSGLVLKPEVIVNCRRSSVPGGPLQITWGV